MDFYDYEEQLLRDDLKMSLQGMYEHGGKNMEEYDSHTHYAYELLKILSMRVTISEFAVLKKQYYAAIYDGEWNDATESEEN